jgi:hypothetical protein
MYGAWRLAWLDPAAMLWFDRSIDGVKRSFWAAAIAYPGFLGLLALRLTPQQLADAEPWRIATVESIGYVIGWSAFPLVILPFCRWLGREAQAFDFIIAYNWSQVLQTALLLLVEGVIGSHVLPEAFAANLELAVYIALLGYEWFIACTALDASGVAATAVVLLDLLLGGALFRITESLY